MGVARVAGVRMPADDLVRMSVQVGYETYLDAAYAWLLVSSPVAGTA